MTLLELREQIEIETAQVQKTLDEISSLHSDLAGRAPTVRELAAAALFLANFYGGVENILKRICRYHGVALPHGPDSHLELAQLFTQSDQGLPTLLPPPLATELSPYRRFRHVVHHGYGFQLRWEDMQPGVEVVGTVWNSFRQAVLSWLATLEPTPQP